MEIAPYDVMRVGITYDGAIYLQDYYSGDVSFYVTIAPEYIAAMLIRLGKSATMDNTKQVQNGKYVVNAATVADEIEKSFATIFKGKRGKRPNVAFYVIDSNTGEILRTVKP